MDFSNLIANEINKKRKQLNEKKSLKKIKIENETSSNTDKQEHGLTELSTKDEVLNTKDEVLNTKHKNDEEIFLESIKDETLNTKLSEFGDNSNDQLSKSDKVRKIQLHMKIENKKERYKKQLDNESKVDGIIVKEDISNPDQKEKLYLQVRVYLKYLVSEWEKHSSDDEDDKRLLYETKKDLIKLLYKLRAHKLSDDILVSLATIIYYLQLSDFLKANESYMKLSIGNVAWPIGVQNIGIHARSASQRITGGNKTASIMIDSKTRRWITAVKRLITFSERTSKSVNNF